MLVAHALDPEREAFVLGLLVTHKVLCQEVQFAGEEAEVSPRLLHQVDALVRAGRRVAVGRELSVHVLDVEVVGVVSDHCICIIQHIPHGVEHTALAVLPLGVELHLTCPYPADCEAEDFGGFDDLVEVDVLLEPSPDICLGRLGLDVEHSELGLSCLEAFCETHLPAFTG